MRTVTFSDSRVAKFVNENFVPAWHDRGPGFHNDDKQTERWIFQSQFESFPTKNICTFFLHPDGRAFCYAAGYYAPDFFLEICRSALNVAGNPKLNEPLAARCRRTAEACGVGERPAARGRATTRPTTRSSEAPALGWCRAVPYRGLKHQHSEMCRMATGAGFAYLAKVFDAFAAASELPTLADIQTTYLSGNPFTEESDRTAPIDPKPFTASVDTGPKPAPVPVADTGRAALEKKRAALKERFEELNAQLLAMDLNAPGRQALQDDLIRLADEIARS